MKPDRRFIYSLWPHPAVKLIALASLSIFVMGCQLSEGQSLLTHASDSQSRNAAQSLPISATAEINGVQVRLEVAETSEQQALGLMHRTELGETNGMLFPFTPPRSVGFWMKNTLIPLDIIYLRDQVVTTVHSNVPPCQVKRCPTYQSKGSIDQVIELAAGQAENLGIKEGDRINVTFLSTPLPANPQVQY